MKLAAVIIVWDGLELLPYVIDNVKPHVDGVIIVWSKYSNRGNIGHFNPDLYKDCILINHEPDRKQQATDNEREKRNVGLNLAREKGFTHFLMTDADELYDHEEFEREKQRMIDEDLNGLVCRVKVYFKEPTLTIGLDPVTYVPFIHKIKPTTRFVMNKYYPFAYDDKGVNHIDPTRKLSYSTGIGWSDIIMHHYSYCRKDIMEKINNSTSTRLAKSTAFQDWTNAKEGYLCLLYGKTLERCENKFNINI